MTECTAFDSSFIRNFAIYFSVHKCGTRLNGKLDFILQCTASQLELSLFQGQRFDPERVCSIRPKFCIHVICRWFFTKRTARTNLDLNDIIRHPGIVFLFQYLYSALCPGHPFCKCLNRHHTHYHADCQHCTDQAFSYPFSHCTSCPFVFLFSSKYNRLSHYPRCGVHSCKIIHFLFFSVNVHFPFLTKATPVF